MRFLFEFLNCVKTSYIPALLLFVVPFFCSAYPSFEPYHDRTLLVLFYVVFALNIALMLFSKNIKHIFFLILLGIVFVCFNRLRAENLVFETQSLVFCLELLLPLNFLYISHLEKKPPHLFYLFAFFMLEASFIENFYLFDFSALDSLISYLSYAFWAISFFYLLFSISRNPNSLYVGEFFVFIALFIALQAVSNPSTFLAYLFGANLILLVSNLYFVSYHYFKDELTGVYSKNSFNRHDLKKFPPKYTLSFFYIDNYAKLLKVFGQKQTDKLTLMVIRRLQSLNPPAFLYRLRVDEFCLIFFDSDIKEAYAITEDIRRLIAKTEFVLSKKKILKLTITPVVSEKRRSDVDAHAVLLRMHESFQQKYKFTQNMTFCEEIERLNKSKRLSRA